MLICASLSVGILIWHDLLPALVNEVEIDGHCLIEYVIVLAVGHARDIDVRPAVVDVHDVINDVRCPGPSLLTVLWAQYVSVLSLGRGRCRSGANQRRLLSVFRVRLELLGL